MSRALRWYDIITINIYWFALNARSQTLSPLVIPLLVQYFVGEQLKGSALGSIRLGALMTAVLVQALMGILSDRSTSKFGRRRPFILIGTLGEVIVFVSIGFAASLEGSTGYAVLFGLYILSAIASNTAHAATQGLIPDLVPDSQRGRYSGVKALFELPLPLILTSLVIGKLVSAGNLWAALITLSVVVVICAALAMLAPEEPQRKVPFTLDWTPFVRLLVMTAVFTTLILGMGTFMRWFMQLSLGLPLYLWRAISVGVGVLTMTLTIGAGVLTSLRIGIGKDIQYLPSFKWWVVNRLAFLTASTNIATFLLFFLQERFSELQGERAAGPAAIIALFVGVFILLTAVPSGWLSDRFGKKPLIAIAGLLGAGGIMLIILVPSMTAIYIGGSIVGAGIGLFYSANWALGTEIVPREQAGRFLGLSNLAGAGAGAIGAYIGGPIADALGYTLIIGMYGFLFLISILALSGIQEKRPGTV
ncbi:MAG TPA: MFS transporter [Bellilinea sp.]|nr:MFS transporter [Bellilinea sp.]